MFSSSCQQGRSVSQSDSRHGSLHSLLISCQEGDTVKVKSILLIFGHTLFIFLSYLFLTYIWSLERLESTQQMRERSVHFMWQQQMVKRMWCHCCYPGEQMLTRGQEVAGPPSSGLLPWSQHCHPGPCLCRGRGQQAEQVRCHTPQHGCSRGSSASKWVLLYYFCPTTDCQFYWYVTGHRLEKYGKYKRWRVT